MQFVFLFVTAVILTFIILGIVLLITFVINKTKSFKKVSNNDISDIEISNKKDKTKTILIIIIIVLCITFIANYIYNFFGIEKSVERFMNGYKLEYVSINVIENMVVVHTSMPDNSAKYLLFIEDEKHWQTYHDIALMQNDMIKSYLVGLGHNNIIVAYHGYDMVDKTLLLVVHDDNVMFDYLEYVNYLINKPLEKYK